MIIGITGTLGAGKGTIAEYLVENKGFKHFSVRDFLTEEIKKRGLPVNRDSMVVVANDLRANNSPSYIAEQLYEQAKQCGADSIIESIRTPGEVNALGDKGNFYLFAVDADPKQRYERVTTRQSTTDKVSFEEFIQNEEREMTTTNPNKQNVSACIKMADFCFDNSTTKEELYKQVEDVINKIKTT